MTDSQLLTIRRVLVVEDEMLILLMIEDMLTEIGCLSITAASSVEEALRVLATESFDIAVLDVNLNGTQSFPVADALAALGVPFFFTTGYGQAVTDGYRDRPVLTKPYQLESLEAMIKILLGGGQSGSGAPAHEQALEENN